MKSTPDSEPGVGLGSETRIIAGDDDPCAGAPCADKIDDAFGRLRWKVITEPDDIGLVFGHEPLNGLSIRFLDEQ